VLSGPLPRLGSLAAAAAGNPGEQDIWKIWTRRFVIRRSCATLMLLISG